MTSLTPYCAWQEGGPEVAQQAKVKTVVLLASSSVQYTFIVRMVVCVFLSVEDVIKNSDLVWKQSVWTSVISSHVASKYLKE